MLCAARLEHVFPYIEMDETRSTGNVERARSMENIFRTQSYERLVKLEERSSPKMNRKSRRSDSMRKLFNTEVENEEVSERSNLIDEVRLNYIEILRSSYHDQIANGSLEEYGDLANSIFEGLDYCEDVCSKGEPLCDWEATKKASDTRVVLANRFFLMVLRRLRQLWRRERKCCSGLHLLDPVMFKIRFLVRQNLAFVRAHR